MDETTTAPYNQQRSVKKSEIISVASLLAFSFWFRLPFVLSATYGFRQTQTAWPVKAWLSENEFSPFNPKVPIRGMPQEWLLEFPLFQWVSYFTALILNISSDTAVALVAVACWFSISILTYLCIRKLTTALTGFASLILLLFSPFGLRWGSTGLSDLISTTFGILALYLVINLWAKGNQKPELKSSIWIYATVLLVISAMIKPNIALMYTVPMFLILIFSFKGPSFTRRLVFIVLSSMSLLLSMAVWTRFASSKLAEYDPRSIWLPSADTFTWYFGSLSQYRDFLSLDWEILYRLLPNLGGSVLFFLAIIGLVQINNPLRKFSIFIFTGIFISWTIFINLNVVHDYYQIPAIPLLVMLISIGLHGWVTIFREKFKVSSGYISHVPWIAVMLSILLSYQFVDSARLDTELVRTQKGPTALSREVARYTSEKQGLIIGFGMTHNPTTLYQSNRRGFLLYEQWYETEVEYLFDQNLENFCYLVSQDEELDSIATSVLAKFPDATQISRHVYSLCK